MTSSRRVVVDTSVILEDLLDLPLATRCRAAMKGAEANIPSIAHYEILKKLLTKLPVQDALEATT